MVVSSGADDRAETDVSLLEPHQLGNGIQALYNEEGNESSGTVELFLIVRTVIGGPLENHSLMSCADGEVQVHEDNILQVNLDPQLFRKPQK
jgi:hypothetical protein